MSGSSSTSVLNAENSPKITSATIITTVTIGRLIAKSEMNIVKPLATAVWRTVGRTVWRTVAGAAVRVSVDAGSAVVQRIIGATGGSRTANAGLRCALIRRRRLHTNRGARRDSLRSGDQQRVTNCDSVRYLHRLARRVAHAERDIDARNLAILDLHDRRTLHARIYRRLRNNYSFLRAAGDAAIGIESGDQCVALVRNRCDDLHLARGRIDRRTHARHLAVKFLADVSCHGERHIGTDAKHRYLIRRNRGDESHSRRVHDGEQCTARLYNIAGAHTLLAHDAIERSRDACIVEILLRGRETRLCIFERSLRTRSLSLRGLEIALRDRAGLQQRLTAL